MNNYNSINNAKQKYIEQARNFYNKNTGNPTIPAIANTPTPKISVKSDKDGYIQVKVYTGRKAQPVVNATVTIIKELPDGEYVVKVLQTDESGITDIVTVPTVSRELSQQFSNAKAFDEYKIRVNHPNFMPAQINNARVFEGIKTIPSVTLFPKPSNPNPPKNSVPVNISPTQAEKILINAYNKYEIKYPNKGKLKVTTTTGSDAIPVKNSVITVSKLLPEGRYVIAILRTDSSGETVELTLPAESVSSTLNPDNTVPKTTYDITAEHPSFSPQTFNNVPIYQNETAIQPVDFMPITNSPTLDKINNLSGGE